jgi:hypothetical protein
VAVQLLLHEGCDEDCPSRPVCFGLPAFGNTLNLIHASQYHPEEAWVLEQAEAFKQQVKDEKLSCKLLKHDRDTKFTESVDQAFQAGKRDFKVFAFRSPNTTVFVERFIHRINRNASFNSLSSSKTTPINSAGSIASNTTKASSVARKPYASDRKR